MFHVWCGGIIFFVIPLTLISPSFSSVWTIGPTRTTTSIDPDEASAHKRDMPCQLQHSEAIDGALTWLMSDHSPLHICRLLDFLLLSLTSNLGIHFYFYSYRIFFILFYLCLFLMREFWVFTIEIVSLRDAWGHAIFSIGGDIVTYCNKTHNFSFPLFACSSFPSPISALLQPDLFSDLILIRPDPICTHTHNTFPSDINIYPRDISMLVFCRFIFINIYFIITWLLRQLNIR